MIGSLAEILLKVFVCVCVCVCVCARACARTHTCMQLVCFNSGNWDKTELRYSSYTRERPVAQMIKICLQCRRPGFDPWVGKIPWKREWQPNPIFLPGEVHAQTMGLQRVGHYWAIFVYHMVCPFKLYSSVVFLIKNCATINSNSKEFSSSPKETRSLPIFSQIS